MDRPVRYTVRAKLWVLALLAFVLGFAGAFVAMGLRAEGGWGRWFPVAIAAAFLVAVFVSPAGAFFRRALAPAFSVGAEGIVRHDGILLPWDALQGAVLFDCQGEEHLGLRFKE